jgi:hypothetical protein
MRVSSRPAHDRPAGPACAAAGGLPRAARAAAVAAAVLTAAVLAAGTSAANLPATGAGAGFTGKAAHIYTLYYEHCKHYTYKALAWTAAHDEEEG